MACASNGTITICRPEFREEKTRVLYCPKCKQKRRVKVRFYESYADYFGIGRCPVPRLKWAHFEPCGYEFRFGYDEE